MSSKNKIIRNKERRQKKHDDAVKAHEARMLRHIQKHDIWVPFKEFPLEDVIRNYVPEEQPMAREMLGDSRIFVNNKYEVMAKEMPSPIGPVIQLSIHRIDQHHLVDWRELQRIKNELIGDEAEGMELFPAESRLVDGSNTTVMYVMKQKMDGDKPVLDQAGNPIFPMFPFGYTKRYVAETSPVGKKQRPFRKDQMPPDLQELTPESIKKNFDDWKATQAAPQSNLIVTPFLSDEPAPDAPAASQEPPAAAEPVDHESPAQEAGITESSP